MFDSGACAGVAFTAHPSAAAVPRRVAVDAVRSRARSLLADIADNAARARRAPGLAAALLAIVCTSACHSTAVDRLNVRAEPTTASAVIDKLDLAGTSVMVDCFVHGEVIHGNSIWYRIDQPQGGYVSGYYVKADANDAAPSC